ncbi:unnamed protein product [Sphagnum balticum]
MEESWWLTMIGFLLGLMFLFSGFLVNALQVLSVLLFLPFSRKAYRLANIMLMDSLWSELVWLLDWWAGVKVRLYTDAETWKLMGNEHALLICNHSSDIDWLVGWLLAQRVGCLGSTRAVMKMSTKFLPVVGWSMWLSEYVFLARNWAIDETTLKRGFERLKSFPRPMWVALFVEGTRFTKAKLAAAQEYAVSVGMQIPKHVLIPRTKGFVSAVQNLRGFVPVVYDMTVAISKEAPNPTILRILKCQSSVVHVHVRRVPMKQLPTTDTEIAAWCREAFHKKDMMLDQHVKANTFGEHLYQPDPRPIRPLVVVVGWGIVLLTGAVWLLRTLLCTRSGIALVAGVLVLLLFLVQVLVLSSQSERSTDPAASKPKPIHSTQRPAPDPDHIKLH